MQNYLTFSYIRIKWECLWISENHLFLSLFDYLDEAWLKHHYNFFFLSVFLELEPKRYWLFVWLLIKMYTWKVSSRDTFPHSLHFYIKNERLQYYWWKLYLWTAYDLFIICHFPKLNYNIEEWSLILSWSCCKCFAFSIDTEAPRRRMLSFTTVYFIMKTVRGRTPPWLWSTAPKNLKEDVVK